MDARRHPKAIVTKDGSIVRAHAGLGIDEYLRSLHKPEQEQADR